MDWIHSALLPFNRECNIWLGGSHVRRAIRSRETGQIMFTDCTHPLQNAWCDPDKIKAWRLADGALSPPLTPDQIAENEACQRRFSAYDVAALAAVCQRL